MKLSDLRAMEGKLREGHIAVPEGAEGTQFGEDIFRFNAALDDMLATGRALFHARTDYLAAVEEMTAATACLKKYIAAFPTQQ